MILQRVLILVDYLSLMIHIRIIKLKYIEFGEEQQPPIVTILKAELDAGVLEIELTLYLLKELAIFELVDSYVGDFLLVFN